MYENFVGSVIQTHGVPVVFALPASTFLYTNTELSDVISLNVFREITSGSATGPVLSHVEVSHWNDLHFDFFIQQPFSAPGHASEFLYLQDSVQVYRLVFYYVFPIIPQGVLLN